MPEQINQIPLSEEELELLPLICPSCGEEIENINYNLSATEYGTYDVITRDYNTSTYEGNESGEYYYNCQECSDEICIEDIENKIYWKNNTIKAREKITEIAQEEGIEIPTPPTIKQSPPTTQEPENAIVQNRSSISNDVYVQCNKCKENYYIGNQEEAYQSFNTPIEKINYELKERKKHQFICKNCKNNHGFKIITNLIT